MNRGFALIELVAALAVMAVAAAVVALALVSSAGEPGDALAASLRAARAEAVRAESIVAWRRDTLTILFRPDGSASPARIALPSTIVSVDPLTGDVSVERR